MPSVHPYSLNPAVTLAAGLRLEPGNGVELLDRGGAQARQGTEHGAPEWVWRQEYDVM